MTLEKIPFNREHLKKKDDTFTVWLSKQDREMLNNSKNILNQSKDSTALKTLAYIGAKTLGNSEISYIIKQIYDNKRKNKRLGLVEFE